MHVVVQRHTLEQRRATDLELGCVISTGVSPVDEVVQLAAAGGDAQIASDFVSTHHLFTAWSCNATGAPRKLRSYLLPCR